MIAHYLIEPEQKHGIDFLSYLFELYNDFIMKIWLARKNEKHIRDVDTKLLSFYACKMLILL